MPRNLAHTSAEASAMSKASALHRTRLQERKEESTSKKICVAQQHLQTSPPSCPQTFTRFDNFGSCIMFFSSMHAISSLQILRLCYPAINILHMAPHHQTLLYAHGKSCTYVLLDRLRRQRGVHMKDGGGTVVFDCHKVLFTRSTTTHERGMDEGPALWMN